MPLDLAAFAAFAARREVSQFVEAVYKQWQASRCQGTCAGSRRRTLAFDGIWSNFLGHWRRDDTGKNSKFPGKKSRILGKILCSCVGTLVLWSSGPLVLWSPGPLAPLSLVLWSSGPWVLLIPWSFSQLILILYLYPPHPLTSGPLSLPANSKPTLYYKPESNLNKPQTNQTKTNRPT